MDQSQRQIWMPARGSLASPAVRSFLRLNILSGLIFGKWKKYWSDMMYEGTSFGNQMGSQCCMRVWVNYKLFANWLERQILNVFRGRVFWLQVRSLLVTTGYLLFSLEVIVGIQVELLMIALFSFVTLSRCVNRVVVWCDGDLLTTWGPDIVHPFYVSSLISHNSDIMKGKGCVKSGFILQLSIGDGVFNLSAFSTLWSVINLNEKFEFLATVLEKLVTPLLTSRGQRHSDLIGTLKMGMGVRSGWRVSVRM